MAIKTSYTEPEILQYMEDVLGATAKKLNLTVASGDFDEAANQVLYNLEQSDYSFVNSQALAAEVRAVARVEAWRVAMYNTAHKAGHSVGAPGTGQTSPQDVYRFCKEQYELAYSDLEKRFPDSEALYASEARQMSAWGVVYSQDYES